MQFTMQTGEEDFYRIVNEEAAREFDPIELVYPKEVPVFEKYDEFVPPELVRKGFAHGVLDVDGMKARVSTWKEFFASQNRPASGAPAELREGQR
jgi:ATP-dependent Lhr-like helicase